MNIYPTSDFRGDVAYHILIKKEQEDENNINEASFRNHMLYEKLILQGGKEVKNEIGT